MTDIPPKAVQEFKQIFKKEYNKELSDKEAYESAQNLLNFFEIIYGISKKEYLRKQRLKKEPKGFHLENGKFYSCLICKQTTPGEQAWWDKYGTKCMNCQRNLNKKILPKRLLKGKFPTDNWYVSWQLKDKFGIHPATLKKLVREGKLKSIKLKNKEGWIYHEIFPRDKNKEYLKTFKQIK